MAREARKIVYNPALPIHDDLHDRSGFKSTISITKITSQAKNGTMLGMKQIWQFVCDPNVRLPALELDRETWTQLNRTPSNHERCNALLHKWDQCISPTCDCGHHTHTIHLSVNECENRRYEGGIENLFDAWDVCFFTIYLSISTVSLNTVLQYVYRVIGELSVKEHGSLLTLSHRRWLSLLYFSRRDTVLSTLHT